MGLGNCGTFLRAGLLLFCIRLSLSSSTSTAAPRVYDKVAFGAIFDQDTEEAQNVFKIAISQYNQNINKAVEIHSYVDLINTADVFKLSKLKVTHLGPLSAATGLPPVLFNMDKWLKLDAVTGVSGHTASYKGREVCNQFSRGVFSMLGAVSSESFETLHSYTNTFNMPFVTPWFPERVTRPSVGSIEHAVSMRPDYHKAVIDTIVHYGWKEIIYLYDSHDGQLSAATGLPPVLLNMDNWQKVDTVTGVSGLLRLQQIYHTMHSTRATFKITVVKRIANALEAIEFLLTLEKYNRWGNKHIVLDCNTRNTKNVLVGHVRNVNLGRRTYHYLLSGLVMDDPWDHQVVEYGAVNITGFRVVDYSRKFVRDFMDNMQRINPNFKDTMSAQAALMYDGVNVLLDALGRLLRKRPDFFRSSYRRSVQVSSNFTKVFDCNADRTSSIITVDQGEKIIRSLKKTEMEGLTGKIVFNEEGHRRNFTLDVVEMTVERAMVKVAEWSDSMGFVPVLARRYQLHSPTSYYINKTYAVVTLLQPPYMMQRSVDDYVLPGNDQYYGLCKDIMEVISRELNIKYLISVVKDGQYGSSNDFVNSVWDGLIGEITRKNADIILASLAVTKKRAEFVDFTQPFVSIAFPAGKSKDVMGQSVDSFSFLRPLSKEIWLCILFSFFAVSIVLFLVSRFSPQEWKSVSVTETNMDHNFSSTNEIILHNEFSIWNSFWFSLGSFMQQGSEIIPRSLSARIVVTVWWFFALVLVCCYTANLAANLISKRMPDMHTSYAQAFGTPVSFKDTLRIMSKNNIDESSLENIGVGTVDKSTYIATCDEKMDECKTKNIDFALALQKGSSLREAIDLVLYDMKKSGLMNQLLRKWVMRPNESDPNSEDSMEGHEITLSDVAGIFYVLLIGTCVALIVALVDFCINGRVAAARANVPLQAALRAKSRLTNKDKKPTTSNRTPTREQDQARWNGSAFAGYYSGNNQGSQDEALQASFSHV